MTDAEDKVNKKLDEAAEKYFRENRRMQDGTIDEIDGIRKDISDIISKYANDDGSIDKRRVRRILREIEDLESGLERVISETLDETVEETSNIAMKASIGALGSLVASKSIPQSDIRARVVSSVLDRKVDDGMSMRNRIWRSTGGLLDELRSDVRAGVLRGSGVVRISKDLGETVSSKEWLFRRIIMTEGYIAYRETIGEVAEESGVIKAVRIIDNRGRHPYHEHHECYRLAEQDMYGWGKGLYRPKDHFIYHPHPQCTAYFRFELVDERKEER